MAMHTDRLTELYRAIHAVASDKYEVDGGFFPNDDDPAGFWMELRPVERPSTYRMRLDPEAGTVVREHYPTGEEEEPVTMPPVPLELREDAVMLGGHRYTNLREAAGKLIDRVTVY